MKRNWIIASVVLNVVLLGVLIFAATQVGSVLAGLGRINYQRMAHDANSGALHPSHILSGVVFSKVK